MVLSQIFNYQKSKISLSYLEKEKCLSHILP